MKAQKPTLLLPLIIVVALLHTARGEEAPSLKKSPTPAHGHEPPLSGNPPRAAPRPRRHFRSGKELLFGQRPFGSMHRFSKPSNPDEKWIGYFYEESFAAVLQKSPNVMVECVLIELRTDREQILAFKNFGSMMALVPLPLKDMILLMKLCGELPSNGVQRPRSESEGTLKESRSTSDEERGPNSKFILPGTLWCGFKDQATNYNQIGEYKELDKCCRAHDHCPLKVVTYESRYGVFNFGLGARSHCLCEEEFYGCLKKIGDNVADMVGNFYFDIVKPQCLAEVTNEAKTSRQIHYNNSKNPSENLYRCQVWLDGGCRFWTKRKMNYALTLKRFPRKY